MNFYLESILLGIGLAADACAVSMANGLKENKMKVGKMIFIAFMFGFFQALMPTIGYFVGHSFINYVDDLIPWIALIILCFLGIKMIRDGLKKKEELDLASLTIKVIFIQAFATSIDALSVGLTVSNYEVSEALICFGIVALVTFTLSFLSIILGKKFGTKFENKAVIFGGIILIFIGIEIFISHFI